MVRPAPTALIPSITLPTSPDRLSAVVTPARAIIAWPGRVVAADVGVAVDEPGHDQQAGRVDHLGALRRAQPGADLGHAPVLEERDRPRRPARSADRPGARPAPSASSRFGPPASRSVAARRSHGRDRVGLTCTAGGTTVDGQTAGVDATPGRDGSAWIRPRRDGRQRSASEIQGGANRWRSRYESRPWCRGSAWSTLRPGRTRRPACRRTRRRTRRKRSSTRTATAPRPTASRTSACTSPT